MAIRRSENKHFDSTSNSIIIFNDSNIINSVYNHFVFRRWISCLELEFQRKEAKGVSSLAEERKPQQVGSRDQDFYISQKLVPH